ncbi:hypothetical protein [Tahibacter sp.]|uniref:hypothetical protein n=1 Tax=Tahibacter sp. TaxID=2056211 RepID=UPI0028C403DE|nr:hypothetical protein [Tahibacter sp.]
MSDEHASNAPVPARAPSALRSALRFVAYVAAAGLVTGVAVWLLFRVLGPDGWRLARTPIGWIGLYLAPFAIGFLALARQAVAERGWNSLLTGWLATAVFALGMNMTSLNGPVMLLAILVFVLPMSALGTLAAWLLLRSRATLPGNPA